MTDIRSMHGSLGESTWDLPQIVTHCDEDARPGYQTEKAHEYNDEEAVLDAKVAILADLLRSSENCVVYTGAGISTTAGISDYATRSKDTVTNTNKVKSPFDALPTLAHRTITALHKAGFVKYWVQQNHDGLPQKAGFPQSAMNEIHGAWYDPSNPVVKMSGQLRDDLFHNLLEWEQKCDLCLVLGTSLCGMNADRIAVSAAERQSPGTVIVNLQRTQYDDKTCLRFFASIDVVMEKVAKMLGVKPGPAFDFKSPKASHTYSIPYGSDGFLTSNGDKNFLDLREDAPIMVTQGPYTGCKGCVVGLNRQGHYKLRIHVKLKGRGNLMAPHVIVLGRWWLREAELGALEYFPVATCVE